MAKIYDKNYSNHDLVIPASIWQDQSVRGEAKLILTLLKRFTYDGKQTCEALTGQMSRMVHTREDSIKRNMKWLHDKNHIQIFKDDSSRTGYSVKYTYQEKPQAKPNSPSGSQLF